MFCGTSWADVVRGCRKRCPGGQDTDCPGDETCFAFTGCTSEKGYGKDPSKWVPGYNQWGDSIAEIVASQKLKGQANGSDDGGGGTSSNTSAKERPQQPLCIDVTVTVTPDDWPQETNWYIIDLKTGNNVISSSAIDQLSGVPFSKHSCLPSQACYQFTIEDAGGDGLCCDHGDGSYRVEYDGAVIAVGGAFFDEESIEFGCSTESPTMKPTKKRTKKPTTKPTKARDDEAAASASNGITANNSNEQPSNSGGRDGGDGGSSKSGTASYYRCVADPLVKAGYVVAQTHCDKFVDCYNTHIQIADNWFCKENESCVPAAACSGGGKEGVTEAMAVEATKEEEEQTEDDVVTKVDEKNLEGVTGGGEEQTEAMSVEATKEEEEQTEDDVVTKVDEKKTEGVTGGREKQTVSGTGLRTKRPSQSPTRFPTTTPSQSPTRFPTTTLPTTSPTQVTATPTESPIHAPTNSPTEVSNGCVLF